jgi:dihydroorotate dehydrogenase electron transfer subunit
VNDDVRLRAHTAHCGPSFLVRRARVTDSRLAGGYARVRVSFEVPTSVAAPGQFFMIRFPWGPALPRALSTLAAETDNVEFFIKADGALRGAMASAPRGASVELRGPYGVPYVERVDPRRKYILVGGGSGVAPLLHFAASHPGLVEATAFGFRSRDVRELLPDVDMACEDETGETADERLAARWKEGCGIIACGPEALLASVARRYGCQPDAYASLETRLGCGFGACLGCSISTTSGTRRVCVDGPLFRCSEIPWLG